MINRFLLAQSETQPKGSALIIAMVIVLLLGSLSAVLMNEMVTRAYRIEVDQEDLLAFEAAESGIDAAINDINSSMVEPLRSTDPATLDQPITDKGNHPVYVHCYYDSSENDGGPGSCKVPYTGFTGNRYKPGCLGTLNWTPPGPITSAGAPPVNPCTSGAWLNAFPYKANGNANSSYAWNDDRMYTATRSPDYVARPRWKSVAVTDKNGQLTTHDPNIVPVSLGDLAFFTYAIDWFHDKRDNSYPLQNYPAGLTYPQKNGGPLSGATFGDHTKDQLTERNMYTIYSTGIHNPGSVKTGIKTDGFTVTIEVVVEATDFGSPFFNTGPLEFFVQPRN
jgi:hypothetical protein